MISLIIPRNLASKSLKQFLEPFSNVNKFKIKHEYLSDLPKLSTHVPAQQNMPLAKKYHESYDCVYEFRYIKHLRLFSRFKVYQTFFSVSFGLFSLVAFDDIQIILFTNGTMFLALIMLFVISRQTVRVVGRMYISDDKTKAMISHLNFFGKRRDFEVNIDDIEPLASLSELKDAYTYFKLKDTNGSMIISVPFGKIHKKDDFLKILGVE